MTNVELITLALLPKQDTAAWDDHVHRSVTWLRENTPQLRQARFEATRAVFRGATSAFA